MPSASITITFPMRFTELCKTLFHRLVKLGISFLLNAILHPVANQFIEFFFHFLENIDETPASFMREIVSFEGG